MTERSSSHNEGRAEAGATMFTKVSIIGLGYIGLPTAAMFASSGVDVLGVDISERAVSAINSGNTHIEEAGLPELVSVCVKAGTLRASLAPQQADAFIVAVPTPVDHQTHAPDVSYVMAAGRSIASFLRAGDLVVLESTSPVGTTRTLAGLLAELRPDLRFPDGVGEAPIDVNLAYCPERIIPGRMLHELVENDRIIGGMTADCAEAAARLYSCFVRGQLLRTDDRTAELCKLTENAFRDVNIAFANELSMICGDIGLNPLKVIELANHHPRVNILSPGPGVGGHCIAVDPWFIVAGAPERAHLIRTARHVNDAKPGYVMERVHEAIDQCGPNSRIACFGLTYKPDVDDFRESPALQIASELMRRYPGRVVCVDPFEGALAHSGEKPAGIEFSKAEDALLEADIVVMLVGHSAFKALARPTDARVIDTIGLWR